jgi:hypothetical protein
MASGPSVSNPTSWFGPRIVKMDDDYARRVLFSESRWRTTRDVAHGDRSGVRRSCRHRLRSTDATEYAMSFIRHVATRRIAEFIRVTAAGSTWRAPLFIAGSYGTTRAANVADVLARWRIPLRGAVLAALSLPLGDRSAALRAALAVPTYTSAAFYWKRLAPELQANRARALAESEAWASGDYARALAWRDA